MPLPKAGMPFRFSAPNKITPEFFPVGSAGSHLFVIARQKVVLSGVKTNALAAKSLVNASARAVVKAFRR